MSRTCILNVWNKRIFSMVSYVQSLLANFVSAYHRITTWPPQKKKKKSASSCFQHLSAKFALFWFWSRPIKKLETDIQKWLWPELIANASHKGEETQMKHSQALKHPQQISSAKQILSRTPKSRENDSARVKAPRFRAMLGEDKMTHYPVLLQLVACEAIYFRLS